MDEHADAPGARTVLIARFRANPALNFAPCSTAAAFRPLRAALCSFGAPSRSAHGLTRCSKLSSLEWSFSFLPPKKTKGRG